MSASKPLNKVILEFGDGMTFEREISRYLDDGSFKLVGGKDTWTWDRDGFAHRKNKDGVAKRLKGD
jgi:hypothetical protein